MCLGYHSHPRPCRQQCGYIQHNHNTSLLCKVISWCAVLWPVADRLQILQWQLIAPGADWRARAIISGFVEAGLILRNHASAVSALRCPSSNYSVESRSGPARSTHMMQNAETCHLSFIEAAECDVYLMKNLLLRTPTLTLPSYDRELLPQSFPGAAVRLIHIFCAVHWSYILLSGQGSSWPSFSAYVEFLFCFFSSCRLCVCV